MAKYYKTYPEKLPNATKGVGGRIIFLIPINKNTLWGSVFPRSLNGDMNRMADVGETWAPGQQNIICGPQTHTRA